MAREARPAVRRRERRRRRLRGEGEGQMMLLAAILLVIGFLALTGIVARINEAGSRTATTQDNPILLEAGPVANALDDTVAAVRGRHTADAQGFEDNLTAALDRLVRLQQSRGYLLTYDVSACTWVPATGTVEVALFDARTRIAVRSEELC